MRGISREKQHVKGPHIVDIFGPSENLFDPYAHTRGASVHVG